MDTKETEILQYAVKLLAGRDYSVVKLKEKLERKFGSAPEVVIQQLIAKRFLNDRRYAENYVARRKNQGEARLRQELEARGIPPETTDEVLGGMTWPSLRDALEATMIDWNLCPPLDRRDVARLFRALARLGYEEDAIHDEIAQLIE